MGHPVVSKKHTSGPKGRVDNVQIFAGDECPAYRTNNYFTML
jgi:hypothetical protein